MELVRQTTHHRRDGILRGVHVEERLRGCLTSTAMPPLCMYRPR
jgi:hypothetical protein